MLFVEVEYDNYIISITGKEATYADYPFSAI